MPGMACFSLSIPTTWTLRSRNNLEWRPEPQATSRTTPFVMSGAQRSTHAEGAGEIGPCIPQKHSQVGRGRADFQVEDHLAHESAVVTRVVDDVQQDLATAQLAIAAADIRELHLFVDR